MNNEHALNWLAYPVGSCFRGRGWDMVGLHVGIHSWPDNLEQSVVYFMMPGAHMEVV